MLEQTLKCHFCGDLYKFYAFSAADQSACPACVAKAERSINTSSFPLMPTGGVIKDVKR